MFKFKRGPMGRFCMEEDKGTPATHWIPCGQDCSLPLDPQFCPETITFPAGMEIKSLWRGMLQTVVKYDFPNHEE